MVKLLIGDIVVTIDHGGVTADDPTIQALVDSCGPVRYGDPAVGDPEILTANVIIAAAGGGRIVEHRPCYTFDPTVLY